MWSPAAGPRNYGRGRAGGGTRTEGGEQRGRVDEGGSGGGGGGRVEKEVEDAEGPIGLWGEDQAVYVEE